MSVLRPVPKSGEGSFLWEIYKRGDSFIEALALFTNVCYNKLSVL